MDGSGADSDKVEFLKAKAPQSSGMLAFPKRTPLSRKLQNFRQIMTLIVLKFEKPFWRNIEVLDHSRYLRLMHSGI